LLELEEVAGRLVGFERERLSVVLFAEVIEF
jgi:hypothetical protein